MKNEIDIQEIININKRNGFHFFDKSAIRFFNSKIANRAYLNKDRSRAFFITSEKFDYKSPRLFTIRYCNLRNISEKEREGSTETIGEFQQYKNRSSALRQLFKEVEE